MTSQESSTAPTLDVPGARLYYQLRGRGPLLLLIGGPMGSMFFAGLADQFAADHTVLTYDPRGISRSVLDSPAGADTPELRADDVRRSSRRVAGPQTCSATAAARSPDWRSYNGIPSGCGPWSPTNHP